jgi:hypothetical protein
MADAFDPVAFLTQQVERLETKLAAEKEENRRLWAAVAHLQRAAGTALGYVRVCEDFDDAPCSADLVISDATNCLEAAASIINPDDES